MRKLLLKLVLSNAVLLWYAAPVAALLCFTEPVEAEDRAVTPISEAPQGIQVSVVNGKLVVTNSAPNPPVAVSKSGAVLDAQEDSDEIHALMPAHIQSLV